MRGLEDVSIISKLGRFTYGQHHHNDHQAVGGGRGKARWGFGPPIWSCRPGMQRDVGPEE